MKNTVLLVAVLSLAACAKNGQSEGAAPTHLTSGQQVKSAPVAIEEIRMVMIEQRPDSASTVNAIHIANDDGVVTLHGNVTDEAMKKSLVERVKKMPSVKDVKDELQVEVVTPGSTGATPKK